MIVEQIFTFCGSTVGILVGLIPKPVIAVIIALFGYACLLVIRKWFFGLTGFDVETPSGDKYKK